jgi:hypothetical protein
MGTGLDTSTAPASAQGPGGALGRRATLRVSVPRIAQGPLHWIRREAARLLTVYPQATAIRRAVGWASLAGASLGVVLAFVLPSVPPEPEDAGRAPARWHARRAIALARPPLARQALAHQPVGDQTEASALQPRPAPAPVEAPISTDVPAAPSPDPARPVAVGPPAAPTVAVDERAPATSSSPTASVTRPPDREETRTAKGRRRDGPAASALVASSGAGAHSADADADELVWLAERAFQAGHSAEAVRLGQKALAAGGGARAQLTIAGAYFDMRDFDHARGAYEAVLAEEPANQAARTGLEISRSALARSLARAP